MRCNMCKIAIQCTNHHDDCNEFKPYTREEFIRVCTTEQLAEVVSDIAFAGMVHGNSSNICEKEYALQWLKGNMQ